MIESPPLQATAVVARNSLAYVAVVLAQNEARRAFVNVADEAAVANLVGIVVDHCVVPEQRTGWYTAQHPLSDEPTPAQVVFTSGTTGVPKGIVLTYANVAHVARRLIDEMHLTSEIREYVGVPASFSFGLGRFRVVAAVGGNAYLPPRGFDPLEFARMLKSGEVNALSVVPTLLRVLLADPAVVGAAGTKLRWLEIGSQYLSLEEKRAVRHLFPRARIVQHYGLTEASRTTFLQVSSARDDVMDSVGHPAPGNEIALTDDGRIRIRGPHVARWRVDEKGLQNLLDEDGWLTTNDLGRLKDGHLFYEGRADDLINCGGVKLVPELLEARIRVELGGDSRLTVAKVPDARRGEGILVAVERSPGVDTAHVKSAAIQVLKSAGLDAGDSLHVRVFDVLPVTETGKVRRSQLTAQFLEASPPVRPLAGALPGFGDVMALFRHGFPGEPVTPDDSFESLGGDSLTYIQFSMDLEKRLGALPEDWPRLSVAQLQQLTAASRKSSWRRLESATLMRAVSMICIVALHVDAFIYSSNYGAAWLLFVLAGYSVARFQLPDMIQSGSVKTLLRTVQRVAVPTVLVIGGMQVLTGHYELRPLLLISNWFDPFQIRAFSYYFLEIYIQMLLLAALLFASRPVRESFRARPMTSALLLLACVVGMDFVIRTFWNTDHLFNRVPHRYAWLFACGVVMGCATHLRSRALALAVVAVCAFIAWGFTTATYFVTGGASLVLFLPVLVVPGWLKTAIAEVAAASMFIYLSHFQVWSIFEHRAWDHRGSIALCVAIATGIAFAHGYGWLERRIQRFAWRRLPRGAWLRGRLTPRSTP